MASQASSEAEHLLLTENFPLLLANRAKILAHPQPGLAWSPSMYLSLAYISGGGILLSSIFSQCHSHSINI